MSIFFEIFFWSSYLYQFSSGVPDLKWKKTNKSPKTNWQTNNTKPQTNQSRKQTKKRNILFGQRMKYALNMKTSYIDPGWVVLSPINLGIRQPKFNLNESPHFVQASKYPPDYNGPQLLLTTAGYKFSLYESVIKDFMYFHSQPKVIIILQVT